jgi:hypothetical protein
VQWRVEDLDNGTEAGGASRREWLSRASGAELVPTTLPQPGTALSTWSRGWPEMSSPGYSPREETEGSVSPWVAFAR